jgi:pimeloyl-ACP methyl ester carboxylesterase
MQTMVQVGADSVWAEDTGGDGQVLVLLHEGIGDARMWDPLWPQLTGAGRVIRYDVRGYGNSPAATEQYSLLADLIAVLDHFGVDNAHLAGCSMGGGAALELAVAEPGRVRSLTLLCPAVPGFPYEEDPQLDAEYEALLAAGDTDGLIQMGLREWAAAGLNPFVEELMRSAAKAGPSEEEFQQAGEPVYDRLAEITAPTVLMVGDKDRQSLIASNKAAAERIPGCRLIIMPGVDHFPTAREPELIAQAIVAQVAAAS